MGSCIWDGTCFFAQTKAVCRLVAIHVVAATLGKALAEEAGISGNGYGLAWTLDSGVVRWGGFQADNRPEDQHKSLWQLYCRHRDFLWEADTYHAYCVKGFIRELNTILGGRRFDGLSQHDLDQLIGTLRGRGNSNATINRKMAALSSKRCPGSTFRVGA